MGFKFFSTLRKSVLEEPLSLVFFPGTGCNESIFKKVAAALSTPELSLIYQHTVHGNTMTEISENSAERLQKRIGNGKAIAVGHSLGGINAAMTVDLVPEIFCGLVLCNTRFRSINSAEFRDRNAKIKKFSRYTDEKFLGLIDPAFFSAQEEILTTEELELLTENVRAMGRQKYLQQLALSLQASSPNYQRILSHLPIKIIQGANDQIIRDSGWEESGLQNALNKYCLELVKCSGGHLSILKHPELVASIIEDVIAIQNNPTSNFGV